MGVKMELMGPMRLMGQMGDTLKKQHIGLVGLICPISKFSGIENDTRHTMGEPPHKVVSPPS